MTFTKLWHERAGKNIFIILKAKEKKKEQSNENAVHFYYFLIIGDTF